MEGGEDKIEEPDKDRIITPLEIQVELGKLRGRVPSFILKDLSDSLKNRNITKEQFEKISQAVREKVDGSRLDKKIEDMSSEVGRLAQTIESMGTLLTTGTYKREEREGVEPAEVEEALGEGAEPEGEEGQREELLVPPPLDKMEVRLTKIKGDAISSRVLMEWIKFLIEKLSFEGMVDVLAYYVDLGWISADVLLKVLKYAKGLKSWQESTNAKPQGFLTPADHIRSLIYIEELRRGESKKGLEEEISKIYHYGWRK
jgi:flagellar protein FlaD